MNLYYAKAYMRERASEVQNRRLVSEARSYRTRDSISTRWRLLRSKLQAARPVPSHSGDSTLIEPACCTP